MSRLFWSVRLFLPYRNRQRPSPKCFHKVCPFSGTKAGKTATDHFSSLTNLLYKFGQVALHCHPPNSSMCKDDGKLIHYSKVQWQRALLQPAHTWHCLVILCGYSTHPCKTILWSSQLKLKTEYLFCFAFTGKVLNFSVNSRVCGNASGATCVSTL